MQLISMYHSLSVNSHLLLKESLDRNLDEDVLFLNILYYHYIIIESFAIRSALYIQSILEPSASLICSIINHQLALGC